MGLLLCVILMLFLPSCAAEPSDQIEPATFEIEPQYIYASDFSHGIAVVEDADGNFSFIDRCCKNVFGKTFFSVEIVNDNRTMFDTFFPSVKERENSEAYRIRADRSPIPPPSPEAFVNSGPFGLLPAYNGYRCASDANGNMGLLNQEQQWVIEPKYGQVYQTSGGQIRIVDGNDVGFFDKDEEKVVFVEDAVDIDDFEEGHASVALISKDPSRVEGPLYNFIDEEGNCLLQQSLSGTKPQLSEGIITFEENGLYGFMDTDGNILVPPSYPYAGKFTEGLAAVTNEKGEIGYIDREGTVQIEFKKGTYGGEFENGLAAFYETDDRGGLIDRNGDWVIKPKYDSCYYNEDCQVWELKYGNYDDREDVYYIQTGMLVKGLSLVKEITNEYIVAHEGSRAVLALIEDHECSKVKFDYLERFSEGLAAARANGKYGYINTHGEWVIAPQFSNARSFSDGLAAVCVGDLWGYISTDSAEDSDGPCGSVSVNELFGIWSATTYVTGGNIQTVDFFPEKYIGNTMSIEKDSFNTGHWEGLLPPAQVERYILTKKDRDSYIVENRVSGDLGVDAKALTILSYERMDGVCEEVGIVLDHSHLICPTGSGWYLYEPVNGSGLDPDTGQARRIAGVAALS